MPDPVPGFASRTRDLQHSNAEAADMYLKEIHKAELDAVAAHTASIIENGGLQKLADAITNEELSRMKAEFALSRRKTQT